MCFIINSLVSLIPHWDLFIIIHKKVRRLYFVLTHYQVLAEPLSQIKQQPHTEQLYSAAYPATHIDNNAGAIVSYLFESYQTTKLDNKR